MFLIKTRMGAKNTAGERRTWQVHHLSFGKIEAVKRSSPFPVLVVGLAGAALIAFGLQWGRGGSVDPAPAAIDPGSEPLQLSFPESNVERLPTPNAAKPRDDRPAAGPLPEPVEPGPASVVVELIYASDRTPAAGAKVSLWREQTGEGAAFRPARRLSQVQSSAEGKASLTAAPHQAVEVYAEAAGAGPIARLRLGALEPDEMRTVRLEVERPPAPMNLKVRDLDSGEPVSGAAIRIVTTGQHNLGLEEFPGTAKLVKRTDGDGHAALPGPVRNGTWLLVDAAGYSPTAVDLRRLDGIDAPEVALPRAAKVAALVANDGGEALRNISIELVADIGGFRCSFTAVTNRRGEATFPRLPAAIPLVPHVGPVDELPSLFDAIQLEPGEKRELRLSL